MDNCYLCSRANADLPLDLKDSFTAHNQAKCPNSNFVCKQCNWALTSRFWYWNPNKGQYSAIYARGTSFLIQGQNIVYPKFGDYITEKAGKQGVFTLQTISELPTRLLIREWLINPPEPPFTICIAESGQKHTLPWAVESMSRDFYLVQFELDTLHIKRMELIAELEAYESLMGLGFSKTEINSGQYRSDRLAKVINMFDAFETIIGKLRGTRKLELIGYVATIAEPSPPPTANPPSH